MRLLFFWDCSQSRNPVEQIVFDHLRHETMDCFNGSFAGIFACFGQLVLFLVTRVNSNESSSIQLGL
jgi:hypothetical protein